MKNLILKLAPQSVWDVVKSIRSGKYFYFLWLIPIKKNKIVISSYYGNGFGDNGKYIVQELLKLNIDYDIVWLLRSDYPTKGFPKQVRTVKYGSFKALLELATAKVWIDNCRKLYYPPKRKHQFYIQTWHGGISLKRVEKDAEADLSEFYIKNAKLDSKKADLFISNSDFCTKMYRNSFWYNAEILECGSPRCDILVNNNFDKLKITEQFNISPSTKIVLYAPTFRSNHNIEVYNLDFKMLVQNLNKTTNEDWVVFIRLHPNVAYLVSKMEHNEKIIDVTYYDDMYEILAVCDLLITDYSSSMFEFSLTGKPVFLYTPDLLEYTKERDFYFELNTLPFNNAESIEELISNIVNFDSDIYNDNLKTFLSKLNLHEDGNAAYEVSKIIEEIINNSERKIYE